MTTVYGYSPSGNCLKVRQILELTGTPFRWVETDSNAGATRTPEYLALNPNGKVPMVVLADGAVITESNAILCHFAEGTRYLPPAGLARTRVLEWLFFEQYSHEPNIATVRHWLAHGGEVTPLRAQLIELKRPAGYVAQGVMESHLATRDFFVGSRPTIADIALYAYTHVAEEGGFALDPYPAVRAWLARVAADPRHIPITD